jgi:hypothetical protein
MKLSNAEYISLTEVEEVPSSNLLLGKVRKNKLPHFLLRKVTPNTASNT